MMATRLRIHSARPNAGAYPSASPLGFTISGGAPCMTIPLVIGVNPLQTTWLERGIVSGRVALLLRSAEIHPLFERFVEMAAHRLLRLRARYPPPLVELF